ncbi:glycosyltransferase family 2 protein [Polynucleobacter asymbioticus]|jgi:rhamnosyltransferase|uniref:Rhamnosyltransferase n=1 Tax=Polynucleobacter asymbioticus TaxID=576611 RepID=A0AAC9IPK5_9BURK|nr:glycosyltransferase family 2 protein [Polynucleobacter asymbioticus]APB98153.1 hypothetical protein A4F89_01790 [Polynucleobacter asymbioticus]APC00439.1 hypothetical protein AOC25_01795 [Polynucleobacter asymbioticus]
MPNSFSSSCVAAIVVTYFPREDLLRRVLGGLSAQVDQLYVIDNTPRVLPAVTEAAAVANPSWLSASWLDQFGTASWPTQFYPQGKNLGIATAQNIGIAKALANGCTDFLFFDQDSAPPDQLCQHLFTAREQLEAAGTQVGMIGPIIVDEKTGEHSPIIQSGKYWVKGVSYDTFPDEPISTEYIISSGSLISAQAIKIVGPMLDCLFIDWVDVEWGLRAQKFGMRNFVLPTCIMKHSIGDDYVRVGKKVINTHSDVRNFFIVRNASYLVFHESFKLAWKITVFAKLPLYILFFTASAHGPKWRAFKNLMRAFCDGLLAIMGPAPAYLFSKK